MEILDLYPDFDHHGSGPELRKAGQSARTQCLAARHLDLRRHRQFQSLVQHVGDCRAKTFLTGQQSLVLHHRGGLPLLRRPWLDRLSQTAGQKISLKKSPPSNEVP